MHFGPYVIGESVGAMTTVVLLSLRAKLGNPKQRADEEAGITTALL